MKLNYLKEVNWIYSNELNVSIGVSDDLPMNSWADIVYAKLSSKSTLKKHCHKRNEKGGYEAFFFFNGAHLRIVSGIKEEIIKTTDPFHVCFYDEEHHEVTNLDNKDVVFEVICAPKHEEGEEVLLDE